jgi:hypothetical protein
MGRDEFDEGGEPSSKIQSTLVTGATGAGALIIKGSFCYFSKGATGKP